MGWNRIEDEFLWISVAFPTQRIADEWIEKAIFGFSKMKLSPVAVARRMRDKTLFRLSVMQSKTAFGTIPRPAPMLMAFRLVKA